MNNALKLCEECLEDLTSDRGNEKISNLEVLIEKVLGFQRQLIDVKGVLNSIEVTERKKAVKVD